MYLQLCLYINRNKVSGQLRSQTEFGNEVNIAFPNPVPKLKYTHSYLTFGGLAI